MDGFVRLSARTATEAHRSAQKWQGKAGSAVDAALLMAVGPAVVSALDGVGPVLVLMPLSGPPEAVAAAAGRLARFGASWVTVSAISGSETISAAIGAVAGTGCRVAVETVPTGVDDAAAAALTGSARGRLVSRLAAVGAASGADGVLCTLADLGVVAQVAPDLVRIAVLGDGGIGEASRRGAEAVVVDGIEALTGAG